MVACGRATVADNQTPGTLRMHPRRRISNSTRSRLPKWPLPALEPVRAADDLLRVPDRTQPGVEEDLWKASFRTWEFALAG